MLSRLRQKILTHLETPRLEYERRIYNNRKRLLAALRPGDVLLVEGRSQMSRLIQLFSSSPWTHAALYVGNRLGAARLQTATDLNAGQGDALPHMIVEAFAGRGVVATPVDYYLDHNIRLCRPYGIAAEDLEAVVREVSANIGKHYDEQNIIELALMSIPLKFNPLKRKTIRACLGRCNDFQVICSGMIARAFQRVGYPIVPSLAAQIRSDARPCETPYGSRLIMRHYSQIMPRDFDISPNFEIIKFNIITSGSAFDYKSLWDSKSKRSRRTDGRCRG